MLRAEEPSEEEEEEEEEILLHQLLRLQWDLLPHQDGSFPEESKLDGSQHQTLSTLIQQEKKRGRREEREERGEGGAVLRQERHTEAATAAWIGHGGALEQRGRRSGPVR